MRSNRPRLASTPLDPAAGVAEMDKAVERMIAQPTTAEAREWLDLAKYPNHAVREMPVQAAREMVAGFYERGAEKVYVLEPASIGKAILTDEFAVKLPQGPTQRKKCLLWAAKHEGDGAPCSGPGSEVSAHHDRLSVLAGLRLSPA